MKRTGVRTQKVRFEMRPQDFMECASNDWYGLVKVDWWKGVPEPRKSVEVKVTNDVSFG